MEKKITVSEYANIRGITVQGVRKAIRTGAYMPGVVDVSTFGKAYVIVVSAKWYRQEKNNCKIIA